MKRRLLAAVLAVPLVWMLLPWFKVLCWGLPLCLGREPAQLPMPISRVRPLDVADTFGLPESKVYALAGFSDAVLATMKNLERDPQALIHEIEALEL
jgi:hypothetical protein